MKLLFVVIALLLPLHCVAQDRTVPQPVMDEFAKDLADMQSIVSKEQMTFAASKAYFSTNVATVSDEHSPLHSAPAETSTVVGISDPGQQFRVLERNGTWYRVEPTEASQGSLSGWIRAEDLSGPYATDAYQYEDMFTRLAKKAKQIKDRWRNNPYISVTGFTVEVGLPPSVSIDFEFK
jgi:hypothetical protein